MIVQHNRCFRNKHIITFIPIEQFAESFLIQLNYQRSKTKINDKAAIVPETKINLSMFKIIKKQS